MFTFLENKQKPNSTNPLIKCKKKINYYLGIQCDHHAPVTLLDEKETSSYTDQFMTITYCVKKEWHEKLQATVHVDRTARPQMVTREQNPSYYKILEEYYRLSGIPAFINTSFNTHEEPIVMTPNYAIRSLIADTVDCLAIGDYLVYNNKDNDE